MAKPKEIAVRCSYLKALPNYENVRVEAEIVVSLEDGDDVKKVYSRAWDTVGNEVAEQLKLFSNSKVKKRL